MLIQATTLLGLIAAAAVAYPADLTELPASATTLPPRTPASSTTGSVEASSTVTPLYEKLTLVKGGPASADPSPPWMTDMPDLNSLLTDVPVATDTPALTSAPTTASPITAAMELPNKAAANAAGVEIKEYFSSEIAYIISVFQGSTWIGPYGPKSESIGTMVLPKPHVGPYTEWITGTYYLEHGETKTLDKWDH